MDESLKHPGSDDSLSCLPSPTCSKKLVSFMTAPPTSTLSTFSVRTNHFQPGFHRVKAQVGLNSVLVTLPWLSASFSSVLTLYPFVTSRCVQGQGYFRKGVLELDHLYCLYSISQDRHPNSKPNLRAGSPVSGGQGLRGGSMISSAIQSFLSSLQCLGSASSYLALAQRWLLLLHTYWSVHGGEETAF